MVSFFIGMWRAIKIEAAPIQIVDITRKALDTLNPRDSSREAITGDNPKPVIINTEFREKTLTRSREVVMLVNTTGPRV